MPCVRSSFRHITLEYDKILRHVERLQLRRLQVGPLRRRRVGSDMHLQHALVQQRDDDVQGSPRVIVQLPHRRGRADHKRHHCSSDVNLTCMMLPLQLLLLLLKALIDN